MKRRESFDRFDFDDDLLLDQQVQAVSSVKLHTIEQDRQANLAAHSDAARLKFMGETKFVC
jgi:hypothetical protein